MSRRAGISALAATAVVAVTVSACGGGSGEGAADEEVVVGVVIPLSGATAAVGDGIRQGYELAEEEINAAGGINGVDLRFEYADHTGDPATGANEARTLIQQKGAVALTGSYESGVTLVVAQTAEQLKVPYLVPYSSATSITESGFEYTFRTRPPLPEWAETMSQFLVWQGENGGSSVSKVGMLVDGTEYGQTAESAYKEAARAAGFEIVGSRTFEQGQTNLSSQMTQLRESGAQAIYGSSYLQSSMGAIRSMNSLGWTVPYMTIGSGIVHPAFFDLGKRAEGVTSSTSWSASLDNEASKAFAEAFQEKYDTIATDDDAYAYSAAYVLKEAIENGGEAIDSQSITESLRNDEFSSEGANIIPSGGSLKFDEKGQAHPSILMAQVQAGKWKAVFPEQFATADFEPIG